MQSTTKKAIVATIELGFAKVEGLMMPDGAYAIAVPQLADIFQYRRNYASQTFKRILGDDFSPHKISTELGKQKINVINLPEAVRLIKALAINGNPIADEFLDAILEEGLDRRFARAFNLRVDEEEYDARIRRRMDRILARTTYTDFIRDRYLELYGTKPPQRLYRDITVMVNRKLFGRDHFFCDRDNMNETQQQAIAHFETFVNLRAKNHPGEDPAIVVEKVLQVF